MQTCIVSFNSNNNSKEAHWGPVRLKYKFLLRLIAMCLRLNAKKTAFKWKV